MIHFQYDDLYSKESLLFASSFRLVDVINYRLKCLSLYNNKKL